MWKGMWGAAAIIGGLYWASRQPGGIRGTWQRCKGAISDIRNGEDPMAVGRRFIQGDKAPARVNDPALQTSYAP
jgi:hypothetical protein